MNSNRSDSCYYCSCRIKARSRMCMSGKKTKTLSTFYVSRVLVCRHDFGVHDHTHTYTRFTSCKCASQLHLYRTPQFTFAINCNRFYSLPLGRSGTRRNEDHNKKWEATTTTTKNPCTLWLCVLCLSWWLSHYLVNDWAAHSEMQPATISRKRQWKSEKNVFQFKQ